MTTPTLEYRPGLDDVPAAKSAISTIDGQNALLKYRGIPVEILARESSFEETAWLLLKGDLPSQRELADFHEALRAKRKPHVGIKDILRALPPSGHPMLALQSSVAAMGMFYPVKNVSDDSVNWDSAVRLLAALPTLVCGAARLRQGHDPIDPNPDLDHAANLYFMMFGKEPSPAARKVVDACLILHAEHNMNASTFSARVTGSTLANPYAVISSAVGTLSGPLHGGANEEVVAILDEIGAADKVKGWLDSKRAANPSFKVMGMGHRVYKVKDPRATVLQELAENVFSEMGRPAKYETALELEKYAATIYGPKGVYPNVDFFSGVVYESLGIERDQFTPIFAVARVAGWLAHWLEQLQGNRIFRPEQIYTGKESAEYVPLEKRA